MAQEVTLRVNYEGMDQAIEKANRLVELLREVQQIIDSLSGAKRSNLMDAEDIIHQFQKTLKG